jgi:hypothetical protein
MSTRRILYTLEKNPPEREVRRLLINLEGGPGATSLSQLVAGVETRIADGTEYEMNQKADSLAGEWVKTEGFRFPPEGLPVFESLKGTIAIALLMGKTIVYDNKYINNNMTDRQKRNPLGVVPLADWPGVTPKGGGGYDYAFTGTTIIANPTLPPGYGLDAKYKTNEETVAFFTKLAALQKTVGETATFLLG